MKTNYRRAKKLVASLRYLERRLDRNITALDSLSSPAEDTSAKAKLLGDKLEAEYRRLTKAYDLAFSQLEKVVPPSSKYLRFSR